MRRTPDYLKPKSHCQSSFWVTTHTAAEAHCDMRFKKKHLAASHIIWITGMAGMFPAVGTWLSEDEVLDAAT